MCRLCNECKETIHHAVSGCPKYVNTLYLRRRINVARYIYNRVCEANGLPSKNKWYGVEPQSVVKNNEIKVLWDFGIQTDKEIIAIRPDIAFTPYIPRAHRLITCFKTKNTQILHHTVL